MAEMVEWEERLNGVKRLLEAIKKGPRDALRGPNKAPGRVTFDAPGPSSQEEDDLPGTEWTSAPLLTLLHAHAMSGHPFVSTLMNQCIAAVSYIWMSSFRAFLIWGQQVAKEPLVQVTSSLSSTSTSTASSTTYTFPAKSLPEVPNLSNAATRTTVLTSLSTVTHAISVLHSIQSSDARENSQYAGSVPRRAELSRALRKRLESELKDCTGPNDESFFRRISAIEGDDL
jgi:hypothetical protein